MGLVRKEPVANAGVEGTCVDPTVVEESGHGACSENNRNYPRIKAGFPSGPAM